ncbi:hypothetical protein E0494_03060 [Marinilabiliaceae bacterium JC040]|nr:hypothetical protein [Marinilabiliaceae bacterium JC040]
MLGKKLMLFGLLGLFVLASCSKKDDEKKVLESIKLSAPADKAMIEKKTVNLEWTESSDKTAKYDLYLGEKSELVAGDIKAKDLPKATTSFTVDNLVVGKTYFWKVVVKNADNLVAESAVQSFSVKNHLPTNPVLTLPAKDAKLVEKTVTMKWNASTDVDGDAITYDLYFSETEALGDAIQTGLTKTNFSKANLKDNTKYYWKVVAKDVNGGVAESEVFSFTTEHTPVITLTAPADEYKGDMPEKLTWTVEAGFTYKVFLGRNERFAPSDEVASRLTKGEYVIKSLQANAKYYWQIVAVNAADKEFRSAKYSFTYEKAITGPVEGTWTDTRDGHVYKTVTFKGTTWLAENFAFIPDSRANDAYLIPGENTTKDGKANPAYANVAENANYKQYGLLYKVSLLDEDVIPKGWHIATDEEWNTLEESLGMNPSDKELFSYRGSHATALKKPGAGWGQECTNTSKMNVIPAGYGKPDYASWPPKCKVDSFEGAAYFWTSSKKSVKYIYRKIANDDSKTGVYRGTQSISYLMSIRLVKDAE